MFILNALDSLGVVIIQGSIESALYRKNLNYLKEDTRRNNESDN
jgi:hypothetical protein